MAFNRIKRLTAARRESLVMYARQQLFGYRCGMAGEKEWLKPLKGREAVNWYWPSKYLLADFNLSHYLYHQANRMCKQQSTNPFRKVDQLFGLVDEHRKELEEFLNLCNADAIAECPTLIDLQKVLELSKNTLNIFNTTESHEESNDADATMNYSECTKNLQSRRRYIDNMYYRRRLSYLELIKKKNFKRHKVKEHYLTHPDDKIVWPDNKGPVHRRWPSVY